VTSDSDGGDQRLSLGLSIAFCAPSIYAIAASFAWPPTVRLFPLAFGVPALVLAAFAVFFDWRSVRTAPAGQPPGLGGVELTRTVAFFGWLTGILVVTVLFGQHVALPGFIALYLMVWGGYNWKIALAYAAAGLAIMLVLFDYLSPTLWYPALLPRWWYG